VYKLPSAPHRGKARKDIPVNQTQRSVPPLLWQSKAILLLFLPLLAAHLVLDAGHRLGLGASLGVCTALGIAAVFGLLVWRVRAATPGGAAAGAIVAASLSLWTPGWHTALWPLAALLVLTLLATRAGRSAKEKLGLAEDKHGRTAAQVMANLGVAALCGVPFSMALVYQHLPVPHRWLVAMTAALAEATADTLSSEIGQVIGGEPRLLTTLRRVLPGTDGAITLAGTLSGCAGAAAVAGVAWRALPLAPREAGIALGAAILGLFLDSLLGEWIERRGWLNNDAVNTLSTLSAALLAASVTRHF
jgi:uncharacterized protein (TIGR00297 family)